MIPATESNRPEPREAPHSPARCLLVASLLLVLVLSFWWLRVVDRGEGFPGMGDAFVYYFPHYRATAKAWLSSGVPLWNPYQLCGVPWLAAAQGGVLYPFHVLYLLLPTGSAMALSMAFHIAVAALAMMILARRLGLGWIAAFTAGALLSMRGHFSGLGHVPNMVEVATWLVPGAIAVSMFARGERGRPLVGLALCAALSILAGYPQYTVYSVYGWAGLLVVFLWDDRAPARRWGWSLLLLVLAVGLGAGLAAMQLLPTYTLSSDASRGLGQLTTEQMFPYGAGHGSLWTRLSNLLGSRASGLFFGFGAIALGLVPLGLLHPKRRRLAAGLIALSAIVLAFGLGSYTKLFFLYEDLPLLGSFRMPRRISLIASVTLSLGAGIGLDAVRLGLLRLFARDEDGAVGAHTGGGRPRRLVAEFLCTGAIAASILYTLWNAEAMHPRLPYRDGPWSAVYRQPSAVFADLALSRDRVLLWNPGASRLLPPKLASNFGFRSVDDYEPMALRRQGEYLTFLGTGRIETSWRQPFWGRIYFPSQPDGRRTWLASRRLIDLTAARYVLVPRTMIEDPLFRAYERLARLVRRPQDDPQFALYENPNATPRAFVIYRARPAPAAAELLPLLAEQEFDPLIASYIEGLEEAEPGRAERLPPRRGHPAHIERDESRLVEVSVDLAEPGFLVLADSYAPGWHATVDGEVAAIRPANHLFRGVAVAKGQHVVRFEYSPRDWRVGLGLSMSTGALVVVLSVRTRRTTSMRSASSPSRTQAPC